MAQLDEEGVVQVLRDPDLGDQAPVLAAVGRLQFEVATYRLENEFGAPPSSPRPATGWPAAPTRRPSRRCAACAGSPCCAGPTVPAWPCSNRRTGWSGWSRRTPR
ncbi:MAG: hypothetical protein R2749_02620 [Acidimicrobiales bacterium]